MYNKLIVQCTYYYLYNMHMKNANKLTWTGLFSLFKTMYSTLIISQTVFQDYNKIQVDNKTKSSYAYQELSLAERFS